MKYFSKSKIYKNSTGTNKLDPINHRATSYNWWTYYTKVNGVTIFNNSTYSTTTSKHQRQAINIANPDIIIYKGVTSSLDNPNSVKADLKELIRQLSIAISKKKRKDTKLVKNLCNDLTNAEDALIRLEIIGYFNGN